MFFDRGLSLKVGAPAGSGLFDEDRIVPSDGKIGYVAHWWIIEKSACDEFLIVELMRIPRYESLDGVVGREASLHDDLPSSGCRVRHACRINKEVVRPLRSSKIRDM